MNYLDNPQALPKERGQQLLLVARLMEDFANRLQTDNKQAAADFLAKAETLFSSLRNKQVAQNGDFFHAAFLARQMRTAEALDVLQQCWESSDPELLQLPAVSIMTLRSATPGQLEQLAKILAAAAARRKQSTDLLMVLAVLQEQQRQFDKAKENYRAILAQEPRNYRALSGLSLNLARSGQDLDEALKLVNRALAVSGPLAAALDSRAIVYIARQEFDKALEDLDAAIRDDGTPEQYFHQAWALSLLGRKTEAAAAFKAALGKHLDANLIDPHEIAVFDRLKDGL